MSNAFVVAGMLAVVLVALGLARLAARRREEPVDYANEREERLTRRLAATLGCTAAGAHLWLRKELEISPDQTDDNLLKRAAYHFRRDQPDAPCPTWRGGRPG
ncbi:MAG TPA: hypothetical protein VM529_24550 [Gemmata sp.]|nr:hypothetical protein [Gemmata sp.]